MTLDALIIFAGSFVAVLPFLGFPSSWDRVLFLLAGIFVIGLGIALRRRGYPEKKEPQNEIFVDEQTVSTHDTN